MFLPTASVHRRCRCCSGAGRRPRDERLVFVRNPTTKQRTNNRAFVDVHSYDSSMDDENCRESVISRNENCRESINSRGDNCRESVNSRNENCRESVNSRGDNCRESVKIVRKIRKVDDEEVELCGLDENVSFSNVRRILSPENVGIETA